MQGSSSQPTIEQLLTHAAWVQQLARRLVQDDERAGDVVQDAWVKAIEHPPILAADASPRPWLKVVVRNLVAQLGRDTARREQREREAARPEAVAPVDRAVAREAARREVVEAVFELPEPYREAIVLRYFDELSPSAIAERLRVPGSTVRSRLQRAHEMLRTRLAGRDDDQRRSLALVLAPLVSVRTSSIPLAAGAILVSTKLVVLSACAAAAALLVAWTLLHSSPSGPTSLASGGGGATASPPPSSTTPADVATHEIEQPRVATDASDTHAASNAAASVARRIRVVRADNDDPITGVRVHWASAKEIEARVAELLPPIAVDTSALIALCGHELATDAEGFVSLPEVEYMISVTAQHDDLWGRTDFPGTGSLDDVLALFRDAPLFVQVVDTDGAPVAGVPVAANRPNARGERSNDIRTSARDGIATFAHILSERFGGRPEGTLNVDFAFPHAVATAAVIDANPWPSEPLRLTLPAVGRLRVKLLDAGGRRYEGRAHGTIIAIEPKGVSSSYATVDARDGELLLDPVGIGLTLSVSVLPRDFTGSWHSHGVRVDGPTTAGQEVVTEFSLVNENVTVTARALDDAGNPIRNAEFLAGAIDAWGYSDSVSTIRSDEDGRVTVNVDPARDGGDCPRLQLVARALGAGVDIALPSCAKASAIDLGDLRLVVAPLLATGRVVDTEHAPIAGARVSLLLHQGGEQAQPELAKLGYVTVEWEPIVIREARSDADGRFEVRGTEEGDALALQAKAPGFAESRGVAFTPGATPVELVLARESVRDLTGRLRCSHSSVFEHVGVLARSATGTTSCYAPDRNGRFRLTQVPALPVDLEVRVEASNDALLTIVGITSVDDPRLRSIDIDEFVHAYEIDVESPLGARIRDAQVGYWQPISESGSKLDKAFTLDGHATIASTRGELELLVKAPGFRNQTVKAPHGRTRVVLEPGFEVVLRVPESLAVVETGFALEVSLRQDGLIDRTDVVRATLHGERELHTRLPRDGAWTLDWILVDEMLNGRETLQSVTIDVGDGLPAPLSELTIPRSDLDARIAKWLAHHKR